MSVIEVHAAGPRTRQALALASPLLIVGLGHYAAVICTQLFGQWAWVGVSVIYWGSIAVLLALFGSFGSLKRWLRPSVGQPWWLALAVVLGLAAFPILLIPNVHLLSRVPLAIAWFFWGMGNAFFEEVYWRGFLLDETQGLPRVPVCAYCIVLFTAIHPLMLGVFAKAQAFDPTNPLALLPFGLIVAALATAYTIIYLRTGSLRLPIFSHYLSDLGNMSLFIFMNLIQVV